MSACLDCLRYGALLTLFWAWLLGGAAVFRWLETPHEDAVKATLHRARAQFMADNTCVQGESPLT